ncbi:MAG: serine/threonine protein kinase [Deltaproteobacteria bacterium]|nr:serine/threonine protein kinase [Deltaproteobacteria bacterium]
MARTPGSTLAETREFALQEQVEPTDGPPSAGVRAAWIADALEGGKGEETRRVALRPGDAVPGTRYVIERWLGDGGMGVVYQARHVDIDRQVAIKVLRKEYRRRANVLRQFRNEARIVARIGSRHIAEVHDFAELDDGRLMFVMELLSGGTVAHALQHGPMDPGRVIAILRQVCKALAAAHAVDIVHRDLKPDNIALATLDGRADFVKVLDFGIAVVQTDADVATQLAAGTPWYLAPEVIAGGVVGASVDIYAAGCTAYEMLTGQPPFAGYDIEAVLRGHLRLEPTSVHERRAEVPLALSELIGRCLAKDPVQRPRDMLDLEAQLCEAQIEAGLQTAWDDLEIPDVAPERRVALLRRMPDVSARAAGRGSWRLAVGGAVLAALTATGVWFAMRQDAAVERGPIDAIVVSAHEAAARSYFVYPPLEAPDQPTAYNWVIDLERRADELGDEATQEAAKLRAEFAATLVRLGDEYWEREGGKPFAVDYYAEALMFEPGDTHAADRVLLTPGELATLRDKATRRDFSSAELSAVEPLVALAEPDAALRSEKVAALVSRERASTTTENLAKIVAPSRARRPREAPAVATAEPTPSVPPTTDAPTIAAAPATTGDAAADPVAPAIASARDPAAAAALVREARSAMEAGRRAEAGRTFERALAVDPKSHGALIGLCDLAFDRADHARAATLARRAIRLAPREAEYRIKLGDALFKAFRYADALAAYREAEDLGHPQAEGRIAKAAAKLER